MQGERTVMLETDAGISAIAGLYQRLMIDQSRRIG